MLIKCAVDMIEKVIFKSLPEVFSCTKLHKKDLEICIFLIKKVIAILM